MTENIGTIKNPLTIIAIFAGIAEVSGTVVLPFVYAENQLVFIYFLITFPSVLIVVFFITLNFNNKALYAPSDFNDEENYIKIFKYDESKQEKVEVSVSQDEMLKIVNDNLLEFTKNNDLKLLRFKNEVIKLKSKTPDEVEIFESEEEFTEENLVSISNFEDAHKLINIFSRKGYPTEIYEPNISNISYSDHKSIWLGKDVSFEFAKDSIITAKKFYPHLSYIALPNDYSPEYIHYQTYIGGSTETAKEKGVKPFTNKDWNSIKSMETIEELHGLINSK